MIGYSNKILIGKRNRKQSIPVGYRCNNLITIGQEFRMPTIFYKDKTPRYEWFIVCKCDCGQACLVQTSELIRKQSRRSCGCYRKQLRTSLLVPEDRQLVKPGQVYDRLLVLGQPFFVTLASARRQYVVTKCSCGVITTTDAQSLLRNTAKSCGCLSKDTSKHIHTKHGQHNSKLYSRWESMKQRCLNPKNTKYHLYGGRGITICDEWLNYEGFKIWAEQNGFLPIKGISLDRIDPDKNYCPENCRWIDKVENSRWVTKGRDLKIKELQAEVANLKEQLNKSKRIVKVIPDWKSYRG